MQMRMMMNMTQRAELLQELGLVGEQFDSTLVRTERMLKKKRCQKSLRLVHGVCTAMEERGKAYRGVIDFLVAMSSPQWELLVQNYYLDESSGRLNQTHDWETIDQVDHVLCAILRGLMDIYRHREELEWQDEFVDDGFWNETVAAMIRNQAMVWMPSALPMAA